MTYELFIARRYLTAKRRQAFISVITFISTLGITIGVMALIIAIALITGFQRDVQDKILGSTSHIMVTDASREGLADYEGLMDKIGRLKGVKSANPVVYEVVLLSGPAENRGVVLKGSILTGRKNFLPGLKSWKAEASRRPVQKERAS